MPTPSERSALLFVAAVAASGLAVRGCRALRPVPVPQEARAALAAQIAAVDSAIAVGGATRRRSTAPRGAAPSPHATPERSPSGATRGTTKGNPLQSPIDVDRADATELERIPGIGPALAARIVADRAERGTFGSLDRLQEVRGIGKALAAKIAPYVTFSGLPRPIRTAPPARQQGRAPRPSSSR